MQEWLEANWGNLVTAVSLVLAVYFYFKSLRLRKPTYVIRSNNIFSGLERVDPAIEVKFPGYGPLVKSLTVTKIAFWNAGRATINRQDVVKDREIALYVKDGFVILSAIIIERTDQSNKVECKVNQERTKAGITFDYLDHNQGALIQVFHSGTGNDDLEVKGTIKGSRPLKRYTLGSRPRKKQLSRWVAVPLVGAFWVLLGLLAIMTVCQMEFHPRPGGMTWLDWIQCGLIAFLGVLFTAGVVYALWTTSVPKPLSKVYWDD